MKKQRIAVTGATGLVGRSLVKRLLQEGYAVSALCRKKGRPFPDKVKVIYGDLVNGDGITPFLKDSDILIHLAARILPPEEEMYKDNVIATRKLLDQVYKQSQIKKIIFMSSIAVYGESKGRFFKESDVCRPDFEYGRTKLLAEKSVMDWGKKTGNQFIILRPFNIYGPGNLKGVIYSFYKSIKKNGTVTIYGSGDQKRDFLYVDDASNAVFLSLKGNNSGVFNLGGDRETTLLELVELFEKILKVDIDIKFLPQEKRKIVEIHYSSDLVKKELNWKPSTSLLAGLRKTIAWYEENQII